MGNRFKKKARDKFWKCDKCKHGYMQREESLDKPFDPVEEVEWQAFKCDRCGNVEFDPFD